MAKPTQSKARAATSGKNAKTTAKASTATPRGLLIRPTVKAVHPSKRVQLPTDKDLVMRVVPMPRDANVNGDIFGGWIMAQVDTAGAILPMRMAKGRIATVAVNEFIFKQPVSVGDLLSFYATVTRVGTTSITVCVEVYAQRNPANMQVVKVTEAALTYVAIDGNGVPRALPAGAAKMPAPRVEGSSAPQPKAKRKS